MRSRPSSRSKPSFWSAPAPLVLTAGVAWLQLLAPEAMAETHEATQFSVPAGAPDEYMRAGAAFARELDPNVEISYWDSQSGSLSVSRVEGDRVQCILRASPDIGEALKPLGRFLNGRIEPRTQAMFALAHEVGHCKLRDAFLNRAIQSTAGFVLCSCPATRTHGGRNESRRPNSHCCRHPLRLSARPGLCRHGGCTKISRNHPSRLSVLRRAAQHCQRPPARHRCLTARQYQPRPPVSISPRQHCRALFQIPLAA